MSGGASKWTIVLAAEPRAGSGAARAVRRSHSTAGRDRQSHSCETLSRVIARGQEVAGRDRCVVVAPASQLKWLQPALAGVAAPNLFVRPCDRGSACSLLWPLIHIGLDDPEATVVVLPADREDVDTVAFARSLDAAIEISSREPEHLIVLAPNPHNCGQHPSASTAAAGSELVAMETPVGALRAREFVRSGGLWGDLAFATRSSNLLGLFELSTPWLVRMFHYWLVHPKPEMESKLAEHLFRILPHVDVVERVLFSAEEATRIISVPRCGCSDLGAASPVPRCRLSDTGCGLAATSIAAPRARRSAAGTTPLRRILNPPLQ